jgi:hypothetical protein
MGISRIFVGFTKSDPGFSPPKQLPSEAFLGFKGKVLTPFVLGCMLTLGLGQTLAQPLPLKVSNDAPPSLGDGLFEITPQAGFMGGSSLVGVKGAMLYHGFSLEAAVDQVIGRYATLYPLTLNMVFNLSQGKKIVPFGIVGGGLFLTKPENTVGDGVLSTLGVNVGIGVRMYFNSRFGVRFETKQYFTEIENKSVGHPELLIYQSSSLGVIIAFI